MRAFVFMGPPGAGKGTVAPIIAEVGNLLHISTGDVIRERMKDLHDEWGQRCIPYMDAGNFVPDDMMLELLAELLTVHEGQDLLFDGFPRTPVQAKALEAMLNKLGGCLEKAVLLEISPATAVERCGHRRTCTSCGEVYHLLIRPPEKVGTCTVCGSELELREDDSADMVARRMANYEKGIAAIVAYYGEQDKLARVDASCPVDDVVAAVVNILVK